MLTVLNFVLTMLNALTVLTVLTAFDCVDCADDFVDRRVDDCVTVLALLTVLLTVFDCVLCSWSWCNVVHFDVSHFFLTMLHSMCLL